MSARVRVCMGDRVLAGGCVRAGIRVGECMSGCVGGCVRACMSPGAWREYVGGCAGGCLGG